MLYPNKQTLSLYIHWPFCLSKCPYCDFNSYTFESFGADVWVETIATQLKAFSEETGDRKIISIFFGGGTPSLLAPSAVGAVLEEIHGLWEVAEGIEISLEANPTSLEIQSLPGYRAAGVNRLSLGVQALRDENLQFLGRNHSKAEAIAALKALPAYFDNYSFDLIYARPNQSLKAWEEELKEAVGYMGPHCSLYQLMIEPNTAFYTRYHRGDFVLPSEDVAADMYDLTQDILGQSGLLPYEVSNYAKPGWASRHNLTYWRYEDYIGVGPGAHGRLTQQGQKWALCQAKTPQAWLEQVQSAGSLLCQERTCLLPRDVADEYLLMGLRIREGIDRDAFQAVVGIPLAEIIAPQKQLAACEAGFLEDDGKHLKPTFQGLKMANALWHFLRTP